MVSKRRFSFKHPLLQESILRYIPYLVIILLAFIIGTNLYNAWQIGQAIKLKPYMYVQMSSGETLKAQPVENIQRTDQTLINFAQNWLTLAFSWKNTQDNKSSGVTERGTAFPKQFHTASLAIQPGYREAYMDLVADTYKEQYQLKKYISGENQSYIRFFETPQVVPVKKGVWDIYVVATRTHAKDESVLAHEIFNRKIRLNAVKPSDTDGHRDGTETSLEKKINDMQKQGLQIVEINEF